MHEVAGISTIEIAPTDQSTATKVTFRQSRGGVGMRNSWRTMGMYLAVPWRQIL